MKFGIVILAGRYIFTPFSSPPKLGTRDPGLSGLCHVCGCVCAPIPSSPHPFSIQQGGRVCDINFWLEGVTGQLQQKDVIIEVKGPQYQRSNKQSVEKPATDTAS